MPRIVRPIDRVVYTREMKVYALAIWLDTRNMDLMCKMFKDYYGRRLSMKTLATWKNFCLAPPRVQPPAAEPEPESEPPAAEPEPEPEAPAT